MHASLVLMIAVALVLAVGCGREEGAPTSAREGKRSFAVTRECELAGLVTAAPRVASDRLFVVPSLGGELVQVDPRTLRPQPRRRVELQGHFGSAELSPSGRVLALAQNDGSGVQLVDTNRMRVGARLDVDVAGAVEAIAWVSEDRLLAIAPPAVESESSSIRVVDAAGERALRTVTLPGRVQRAESVGGGLVLLLSPPDGIGPSTLAAVDGEGDVCSVSLRQILSGADFSPEAVAAEEVPMRQRSPGLAVDRLGARAFVVDAGGRVGVVDLRTLSASYHDLREHVSVWRRFSAWLEPEAEAKLLEGPQREALYLGRDVLAVAGVDYRVEGERVHADAIGFDLVDTRSWQVERVDPDISFLHRAGDAVLGLGEPEESGEARIRVYARNGDLRFEIRGREPLWVAETAAGYVYVAEYEGRVVRRIDPETGREQRIETGDALWLIGDAAVG